MSKKGGKQSGIQEGYNPPPRAQSIPRKDRAGYNPPPVGERPGKPIITPPPPPKKQK